MAKTEKSNVKMKAEKTAVKTASKKSEVKEKKSKLDNKMRTIKIEKIVLSVAGTAEKLDKGTRLLQAVTGMKPMVIKSRKRIPSFGVRPGLEVGAKVTMRRAKMQILKRLLQAINNELKESQIVDNHFSFGIHEYIEIPGMEYQRDIGILGLNVTVDFTRTGSRVSEKKIKPGKIPKRQVIRKEEIIEYIKKNFQTKFKEKVKHDSE